MVVGESFCNAVGKTIEPSNKINLKSLFKDVNISKIKVVEITKSSKWTDVDNTKYSIKQGKYPVDKDGNFEIEIVQVK
jgi:hypothetical protein